MFACMLPQGAVTYVHTYVTPLACCHKAVSQGACSLEKQKPNPQMKVAYIFFVSRFSQTNTALDSNQNSCPKITKVSVALSGIL